MLGCQRDLFQLDESVTYLNCAYMSPQLKCVTAAGQHAILLKATPNKVGMPHFFDQVTQVKVAFAQLVGATEVGRVAIIPSTSYGIATVAKNLPLAAGQHIIVAKDQFPSNYYSWKRLADERGASIKIIGVEDGPDKGRRWNEAILEAITPDTAAVALSHVHWAEGVLFDLVAIRRRTREVGAWLVIDGTQSVGALPFDVEALDVDALICGAYKWLMSPYGTGVAWYGPAMDGGTPIEENWINRKGSDNFQHLVNYQPEYQPLAVRYCMGEQSNFVLLPMMEAAFQQLNAWQPARIQAYCQALNAPFLVELQAMGFNVLPEDQRGHHLVGVTLPTGMDMPSVQRALAQAGVLVSVRGASIRVAPHLYNDADDWARLMDVLKQQL